MKRNLVNCNFFEYIARTSRLNDSNENRNSVPLSLYAEYTAASEPIWVSNCYALPAVCDWIDVFWNHKTKLNVYIFYLIIFRMIRIQVIADDSGVSSIPLRILCCLCWCCCFFVFWDRPGIEMNNMDKCFTICCASCDSYCFSHSCGFSITHIHTHIIPFRARISCFQFKENANESEN